MSRYDYVINLKSDKDRTVAFAEGPAGEILYIAAFPGLEEQVDKYQYKQLRDRILNDNHHVKSPDAYVTLKAVSPNEATLLFGLPELSPILMAQADLRQGIKTVTAGAIKEIKG